MAKYSKKAQNKVEKTMDEMKHGKLKSGNSNKKVTNPKHAIAIGLSEGRKSGAKVPTKNASQKSPVKKSASKKAAVKKSAAKKTTKKAIPKKATKKSSAKKLTKK